MPTEQEILKVIRKIIPNSKKYLFDDAAIIEKDLIVTTDTLVENTHFTLKTYTSEEIGWKAMAVNLSDIAAMGGNSLYALISLSLPPDIKIKWIKGFYKGLTNCSKRYRTQVIGGNLARAKEVNITITVIGKAHSKYTPARSNARPGDLVFVTGTFGNTVTKNYKVKIFPQINLGQKIIHLTKKAALMDASDGLADCLIQISAQSEVKIIVDEEIIPIPKSLKRVKQKHDTNPINLALYGGEDYQLVGTASTIDCKKIQKIKGIKIIGRVVKGKGAFLKHKNNKLVKLDMKKAFKHFS